MMKVLLKTIGWMLCIILVILPTLATPSTPPKGKVVYKTLTWNLDNKPETYSAFINSLRDAFIPFGKVCNIPVTPKSPKPNDEFILVDIKTQKQTITVAFKTSNLYFVGYMDKLINGGATRANFVSTFFDQLKDSNLFKDAKIKKKLPYAEDYKSLETAAGIKSRQSLRLGLDILISKIGKIYGEDYTSPKVNGNTNTKLGVPVKGIVEQEMAMFALMTIEMIAEATRFKYSEGMVRDFGIIKDASYKPDDTFILLQTNWGAFSKIVRKSSPDCNPATSPKFPQWDDIKLQVGLLNYVDKVLEVAPAFMEGISGYNNDDFDDAPLEFIM